MRLSGVFFFATLGLAGCATSPWVELPPGRVEQLMAADPPRDDHRFVPGWRIGEIHLGMSRAQLLAAKGEPSLSSMRGQSTEHYFWDKKGFFVRVYEGRVVSVQSDRGAYDLSEPVAFGASSLLIKVKMSDPSCVDHSIPGRDSLIFRESGALLSVDVPGGLAAVYVVAPGELKCP